LQEVQRICPHILALIDSEKGAASAELESPVRLLSPPVGA
jgi:hypothetical protein